MDQRVNNVLLGKTTADEMENTMKMLGSGRVCQSCALRLSLLLFQFTRHVLNCEDKNLQMAGHKIVCDVFACISYYPSVTRHILSNPAGFDAISLSFLLSYQAACDLSASVGSESEHELVLGQHDSLPRDVVSNLVRKRSGASTDPVLSAATAALGTTMTKICGNVCQRLTLNAHLIFAARHDLRPFAEKLMSLALQARLIQIAERSSMRELHHLLSLCNVWELLTLFLQQMKRENDWERVKNEIGLEEWKKEMSARVCQQAGNLTYPVDEFDILRRFIFQLNAVGEEDYTDLSMRFKIHHVWKWKKKEMECLWAGCKRIAWTTQRGTLYLCKRCKVARYCSRRCQKKDWERGEHKSVCSQFR